jgi:hypothetical protein
VDTEDGYPNPNFYLYSLNQTFVSVSQIEIISSAFPNSQRTITTANNMLYWQNYDDGKQIYTVSVTSGNYSPRELELTLESLFANTIRFEYTEEFLEGQTPDIIINATPTDTTRFDDAGYSKYHLFNVSIDPKTDVVSFASFRQLIQEDSTSQLILRVPDYYLDITQNINFLAPTSISTGVAFDPSTELLFVYFTPYTHNPLYVGTFPNAYGNLYQYVTQLSSTPTPPVETYEVQLVTTRALLANFYKPTLDGTLVSNQEIHSINTPTLLNGSFNYIYLDQKLFLPNHQLNVGDLFLTDQFQDPSYVGQLFVYEVLEVIDGDNLQLTRFDVGTGVKFIYDDLLVNFDLMPIFPNTTPNYQIINDAALLYPIVEVDVLPQNKRILWVYQPDHNLSAGTVVTINGSGPVNQVPASTINGSHTIFRIIDENNYEIHLDFYTPETTPSPVIQQNIIMITYPDIFRMFFNYQNTLGNYLSFNKVGQPYSITPFTTIVYNTSAYEIDYNLDALGTEYDQGLTKFNMTGDLYFYLCILEAPNMSNTEPVNNVFCKIYWTGIPGTIAFNSFELSKVIFSTPIFALNELHFAFYNPDGSLVEFNNLNHTFTLKITEIYNVLPETNIDERTDQEIIQHKTTN